MKQQQGATKSVEKAQSEKHYLHLHNTLYRVVCHLWESAIGVECRRAALITPCIEAKLWEMGVIGCHRPQASLNVLFANGKKCSQEISKHQLFTNCLGASPEVNVHWVWFKESQWWGKQQGGGEVASTVGTNPLHCHANFNEGTMHTHKSGKAQFSYCYCHIWLSASALCSKTAEIEEGNGEGVPTVCTAVRISR